jgi:hypothetical protein
MTPESQRPWPRGLRREAAAAYIGVGTTKFDDWVARGLMPKPKRQDGVVVWDRLALDAAFDDLPSEGESRRGAERRDPVDVPAAAGIGESQAPDVWGLLPCCGAPVGPGGPAHKSNCKWMARYGRSRSGGRASAT